MNFSIKILNRGNIFELVNMDNYDYRLLITHNGKDECCGVIENNGVFGEKFFLPDALFDFWKNTDKYPSNVEPPVDLGYVAPPSLFTNPEKNFLKSFGVNIFQSDYLFCFTRDVKYIISNDFLSSATDLERKKLFYNIKCDFSYSYDDEDFSFLGISHNKISKIDISNNLKAKPHQYLFGCNSMDDIVIAILHYFVYHGYVFRKCIHCGTYYYTTDHRKHKYCNNFSPIKKDKNCKEAVKEIRKSFRKRTATIIKNIDKTYKYAVRVRFLKDSEPYLDAFGLHPSIWNYYQVKKFLDKKNIKLNYYKKSESYSTR